MRQVEDETGLPWLVDEGDLSWENVQRPWKAGFHWIVLPRLEMLGG